MNNIFSGFNYPEEYKKIVELGLINFDFWYLIPEEQLEERIMGLKKRYPNRKLVPFARRDDSDDIACFEATKPGTVQIIHDYASEGYEQRKEYLFFWEWFKAAINEMIEDNQY